ncbi:hypothetical protein DAEQUDRAFT_738255 [Daedalea quercina L-15889]|uniref:Uncharacterized protein n=1 Tax=Daedalea quercina L-15889 TaxID=1314783 RepID=A0A165Q7Y8_9APHY|nr:hypothetical protein DAEQUDRAFT_738255 [Daedalea quercina L-15889]
MQSHYILISQDDERYKQFLCPRHPPSARPSYPLVLPPELLINIIIEIASDYLNFVFLSEAQDDDEMEKRLAVNPFPAILQVSRQFRAIAFNVIRSVFGIQDIDGSLSRDAWACLRYALRHAYLLRCGEPSALEEHIKRGRAYSIPPVLCGYLNFVKMACSGKDYHVFSKLLKDMENELMRYKCMRPDACTMIRMVLARYVNTGRFF